MTHLHILPRAVAKERDIKRYFLGIPCKLGHISEKNTKSSTCIDCDRLKKSEYRKKNPEKARASVRRSANKNREARRALNKKWREKNAEYVKLSKKLYSINNPEKVKERKRRYYEENKEKVNSWKKEWYKNNVEHCRSKRREWVSKNRIAVRSLNRNRRLLARSADGTHGPADVVRLLSIQKNKCAACYMKIKNENYHVDHVIPLVLGGSNWPNNLQILCPSCNMSKGAKHPVDFYKSRGFLI